ncbi:hypothetical protein INN71_11230 [Nocardioides sp. ChNu-153]|uniref:hypothetical protein n=1 Tax=unclassified Nocardioides TaxID=2615069 RepID=UPI0024049C39|nr:MULTISPECIES: hypothetical protein [unclassified Nocardioides]MDF9716752.1 hypothetical protein [Nocardioides sp. ChNu-99]MDN7121964.1 hypothetical protein [Nocardioides sp. ChNu-153]
MKQTHGELQVDFSAVAAEDGPPHDVPGLPSLDEYDPDAQAPVPPDEHAHLGTSIAGQLSGFPVDDPHLV